MDGVTMRREQRVCTTQPTRTPSCEVALLHAGQLVVYIGSYERMPVASSDCFPMRQYGGCQNKNSDKNEQLPSVRWDLVRRLSS